MSSYFCPKNLLTSRFVQCDQINRVMLDSYMAPLTGLIFSHGSSFGLQRHIVLCLMMEPHRLFWSGLYSKSGYSLQGILKNEKKAI